MASRFDYPDPGQDERYTNDLGPRPNPLVERCRCGRSLAPNTVGELCEWCQQKDDSYERAIRKLVKA